MWAAAATASLVLPSGRTVKLAAFDMDGTLLRWTCPQYPSKLTDYMLWSPATLSTMRRLHDDGHKLVVFTNQL